MRAGLVPLLISPRNTPEAVCHLLEDARVAHVYASRETGLRTLLSFVSERLHGLRLNIVDMPHIEGLHLPAELVELSPPPPTPDRDATALMLHSSGKLL